MESLAQVIEMKPQKRDKGEGMLYKRGRLWWIGFYDADGRTVRESTKTEDYQKAEKFLGKRLAQKDASLLPNKRAEKLLVSALADSFLLDYKTKTTPDRNASGPDAEFLREKAERLIDGTECRWAKHLKPFFGNMRAAKVSTDSLNRYIAQRQAEDAANGTINRELAMLHKIFALAVKHDPPKVNRIPGFPDKLPESAARQGFIEDAEYQRLASHCSELWLRTMLAMAYTFGFRKGELLNMRVHQINLADRTIRLGANTTKNKKSRAVIITNEVRDLLALCVSDKAPTDFVLTRNGQRVRDLRVTWAKLTASAELPGLLLHDFRRSAVRNMIRRGVPQSVAKKISGHLTDCVFERYNVTSESDLADAALKIENGYNAVTVGVATEAETVLSC